MKNEQKQEALTLRIEKQLSLNQIQKITKPSKSTLSVLLRQYPLTEDRIKEISKTPSYQGALKGAAANRQKSLERKKLYKKNGAELIKTNRNFRDLVFLYWGEGDKHQQASAFSICNTDPGMINFITLTLIQMGYKDKIKTAIYCHNDCDLNSVKNHWAKYSPSIDIKTYLYTENKKSQNKKIGKQPYGTCRITIHSVELLYMTIGAIEKIKQSY